MKTKSTYKYNQGRVRVLGNILPVVKFFKINKLFKYIIGSGKYRVDFFGGDSYDGELKYYQKHGKGTEKYANGNTYDGEWKKGKKHGRGKYTCVNGDVYEGEWKEGKKHGQGTEKYANGDIYDGEWKDNKWHSKGKYTWAEGNIYDGEWKDGERHGRGTIKYVNGNIYEGEWKDGKCNGKGKLTWADGDAYEGEWEDGKKHGRGKYTCVNGEVYDGEWKDGVRHGKGKFTWANRNVYEGKWKDDEIMISSDNDKKENKIPTLVIRSNQMHIEGRLLKYETHKHLPGVKEVEVKVCKNKEKAIKAIRSFSEGIESGDKCRIVFDQHGNRGGVNDLKIDKQGAEEILEYLAEKFKHITISDRSCKGGTSQHFIDVARDFAKNNKVNITIRFTPEDRTCIDALKWKGEQSRFALATIGKDGSGKSREKIEFGTNGICTLTNGDQYKGEWRDGKKHGRGTYTCTNGIVVYDGEWKEGKVVSKTELSENITDCEEVKRQVLKTNEAFSTKHEFIPGRHINSQNYTRLIAKAEVTIIPS